MLIAFAGEKTRQHMTEIFEGIGVRVSAACGSGAEILRWCGRMGGGVILCGYKLYDMTAEELYESLPENFSMVLLATPIQLEACEGEGICRLAAPAQKSELIGSVKMLLEQMGQDSAPVPKRTSEDKLLIAQAKALLMERNRMTEEAAHRFLQKRSMDTGAKMVQTAMQILDGEFVI
jgi:response regulator NasT